MSLIQPLKFRTLKTGCFKMPCLQMAVFQTGITVASGHYQILNFEIQFTAFGLIGVHVVFHVAMEFKLDIGNKFLKTVVVIVMENP